MTPNQYSDFVLPAEWECQSGIQLTWPHVDTDWKPYLDDITQTFIELTREIARREKLLIVTPDIDATRAQIVEALGTEILTNILFYECQTNDTWARDHGAITMVAPHPATECFANHHLLDFKFNGWGEKFDWRKDNAINIQLYYKAAFHGALENHNDFVLEGGSIESDGRGTIMTTSQCLLAPHRNQPLSQKQIEERLLNHFNAHRVIWIDHGNLIGDDTDGHIDTIVRMAPDDTLVYVGSEDAEDCQHEDFMAMERQLQSLTTAEGHPYRLLKLPMPRAMYDDDDRLPATYANFVILNGAVIVPTYHQPDLDRRAIEVIGQAFPDREIVGIDASTVVRQHGSLHCLTMQFPQGVLAEG
ncbi:MAG: agmatine deiminase family protein [Prevotella sp.]|nr:agmatine deiminase family protein [Prevotella sp.]